MNGRCPGIDVKKAVRPEKGRPPEMQTNNEEGIS